jgi:hypothetical protein
MNQYEISFSTTDDCMTFDACNEEDAKEQAYDWWYGNVVPLLKVKELRQKAG